MEREDVSLVERVEFSESDDEGFEYTAVDVGDAGSTALVAMVRDRQIVIANAGDCRALLLQRGARAAAAPHHCVALSVDHKPDE